MTIFEEVFFMQITQLIKPFFKVNKLLFAVFLLYAYILPAQYTEILFNRTINLDSTEWKYQKGFNEKWVQPDFDDKDWSEINIRLKMGDTPKTTQIQKEDYSGIFTFRKKVYIDSSFVNKPVGLQIRHHGASEIYIDGKPVNKIGEVSENGENEKRYNLPEPFPVVFTSPGEHLIAIKYSNNYYQRYY
ncbi:MAG: hypothetical protein D6707_01235, partial [Bacteroidetes bacterium]